ncbi:MAG: ribosomal protein S18-alanine N-acetyltransferase [Anaerolineales bacterium]|nr:ribosomal protein S18-alanine N-acetyltransferase [Anaerolineales bacterium]
MNLIVRKMTLDDLEQVVAIDQASFSLPWPPRSFRFEVTENPASRNWVAEANSQIVGLLVGWLIVDELHIATLAVHPNFRRQGVGEKLLVQALQSAGVEGAVKSFLEVRASNQPARALYQKFGYVEDGVRKGYYKDNQEDAILMTLERINV